MAEKSGVNMALVRAWFRVVWGKDRWMLVLILVGSVLNAFIYTALPWLWQFVIEEVQAGGDETRLTELGIWMAVAGVSHGLFYILLQGARSVMNARIMWRARSRVFDHLSELSGRFYRDWRVGDLVTRMSDDAGQKTAWFMCSGIMRAYESMLVLLVCLGAMLWIDPIMTVVIVAPLPLLIVGQALAQGALERRYRRVQSSISDINDVISATFSGIRIVQACRLESAARSRFRDRASEQRDAEISASRVQQAIYMMYGYGWQLAIVALLLMGGSRVLSGELSLGEYITFEGFLMTLIWPMFDFGTFLSKYKQTGVALERLQELMDARAPLHDVDYPPNTGRGPLVVRDLSVGEDEAGAPLVRDVELEVEPGSMVAVVGSVGAGKSVLLEALAGLREPRQGSRTWGQEPLARASIAYVPQDPILLSVSVRENIAMGREVDEATLEQAVRMARLEQDLEQLPGGLDTVVGERGVTLSGGQQQRVALARALVEEPRLLILDDATAALDADTEAAFWSELESVLPGVAAVVVTHRVATIERADEVLVLEGGAVVERGRHAELLERGGAYARIYGRYRNLARVESPD